MTAPASPEPIPILRRPGIEYRMREWRNPNTHEVHWLLETQKGMRFQARLPTPVRSAVPHSLNAGTVW